MNEQEMTVTILLDDYQELIEANLVLKMMLNTIFEKARLNYSETDLYLDNNATLLALARMADMFRYDRRLKELQENGKDE